MDSFLKLGNFDRTRTHNGDWGNHGLYSFCRLTSKDTTQNSPAAPHSVPWDQSQLGAVLKEDIARALRRVNAHAIICDDGAGGRRNVELLSHILEHRREGRFLRHAHDPVGQLGVGCERDLERDLRLTLRPSSLDTIKSISDLQFLVNHLENG
jgi:hypothetical protein